jgi:NAD(P)-dependent dehydrogenase (short-subunit alcohol dehydrogenase family)
MLAGRGWVTSFNQPPHSDHTYKPLSSIRVAIVDLNLSAAQSVAGALPGGDHMAAAANVADWDSQLSAFEHVLAEFGGRIDYVYGIAGIGERTWIPNDPHATNFAKPDLAALDVDLNGALYTAALAIQQMRRQEPDAEGFRGKSRFIEA